MTFERPSEKILPHNFPVQSTLSRRSFLSFIAAAAACACGGGEASGTGSTAAAQPVEGGNAVLRKSMHFGHWTSGLMGEQKMLLTLVKSDGSVTEQVLNAREWTPARGVTKAAAVTTGEIVAGTPGKLTLGKEGRIALLQDGGIALWANPGDQALTIDAATVRSALQGRSILQVVGDLILLSDGTVHSNLMERLAGQKPQSSAIAEGVARIKGRLLFRNDGTASIIVMNRVSPKNDQHVLDGCYVVNEQVALGIVAVAQDGTVVAPTRGGTRALDGPKDAVRIDEGVETVAVLTRSGSVWEVNVNAQRQQTTFQVKGLVNVVDIATAPDKTTGAALRRDGTVWLWTLDKPGEAQPIWKVADGVLLPA